MGNYYQEDCEFVAATERAQLLVVEYGDIVEMQQKADYQVVSFDNGMTEDVPALEDGRFQILCVARPGRTITGNA